MAETAVVYILDIPYHADKGYTYFIPSEIKDSVSPGCLVEVPFGNGNRKMTGIVTEYGGNMTDERLKPITSVFGEEPLLTQEMIGLCRFIKEYTLCTFGEAVKCVVPSLAMSKIVTYYRIIPENERVSDIPISRVLEQLGEKGKQVYTLASSRERFSKQSIQSEFSFDCTKILLQFINLGLCEKCTEIIGNAGVKTKKLFSLSDELKSEIERDPALFGEVLSQIKGENRKKLFSALRDFNEVTETSLFTEAGVTPTAGRNAAAALVKKGYIKISEEEEYRNSFTPERLGEIASAYRRSPLSDEQSAARDKILSLYESKKPCAALLHGVTGSGKTNVIMEVIDRVIEDGHGVIMLVPEIALTPQTVGIFLGRYGDNIAVIHSGLSGGEKYDAWRRIKRGEAKVVVGTRSAIFAPLPDIGLIVIDEEHEYTYKSDINPKYLAHDVARRRCLDHGAMMLLASATPSVTSYYKAKEGIYALVELSQRYGGVPLPEVKIYDMRGEASRGNLSPIGALLADRLMKDKADGNKAILFLNRRGYNNYVSCRSCGKGLKCPHCSVTLTYHQRRRINVSPDDENYEKMRRENGYLMCHMCGYRSEVPEKCPECGKDHLLFMGCGTQKAEDDIVLMFPDLRVLRMDFDTTRAKHSHEEILSKFRSGEGDVLLGTQMVTKGHDFPRVSTVGVLNADSALFADDYRASERTFSMITQVIGRAGRDEVPGCAVIQTYNPENEILLLAAKQDYKTFYDGEIKLRKALCLPPFCDIAVITLSSRDEAYLGLLTKRMYERIKEHTRLEFSDIPIVLYGPFEAPVYRVQNTCRMRFVMKCRLNRRTREFISELMCEFGKFTPGENKQNRISAKSDRRITVSVDLNPSTV